MQHRWGHFIGGRFVDPLCSFGDDGIVTITTGHFVMPAL
jgi:hypothetical protein